MQMRKIYILMFLFLSISIFIFIRPTLAVVNTENCKPCHAIVKPLNPITKGCQCHTSSLHGPSYPENTDPTFVHPRHENVDEGKLPYCKACHSSPVDCTKCHNTHKTVNIPNLNPNIINVTLSNSNRNATTGNISNKSATIGNSNTYTSITNYSYCQGCHGDLPTPYGHAENRDALKDSKHKWMNCQTCHNPPFQNPGQVSLHFKDLMTTPIVESVNLCKVCHSPEYKELIQGTHGTANSTCVNCHNPHSTTTSVGGALLLKPTPSAPVNVSETVSNSFNWITEKVPILNNPLILAIIFILIAATVSEYLLSIHEKGTKVAYKMVRIKADENTFKTLEVKLESQSINLVNDILANNGVNVLGMTMTKEANLYEYVIFIDIGKQITEESDIINIVEKVSNEISSLHEVNSVEITDRYEL